MQPATLPEWFVYVKETFPEVAAQYRIAAVQSVWNEINLVTGDESGRSSEAVFLVSRLWFSMASTWQILNLIVNPIAGNPADDLEIKRCSELSIALVHLARFIRKEDIQSSNNDLIIYFERCLF